MKISFFLFFIGGFMKVSVIMGSKSDEPVMNQACQILDEFGVEYEKKVVSAHRTPHMMVAYAQQLESHNIGCVIAGAGGAAHLPGMVSSMTCVPVIGVPIQTSTLKGMDSLLSIVQMPKGIPVLTMSINGAANAAYAAIEILALQDKILKAKLIKFKENLEKETWETQFDEL